ncbi:unnamed protein product [Sympodiomycopsis kandeliae]
MGLTDFFSFSPSSTSPTTSPSPSSTSITQPLNTANKFITEKNPQGIKPCCACPETKIPRDDCFLKYGHTDQDGEEGWRCKDLVEAHRQCMKKLGFNI